MPPMCQTSLAKWPKAGTFAQPSSSYPTRTYPGRSANTPEQQAKRAPMAQAEPTDSATRAAASPAAE